MLERRGEGLAKGRARVADRKLVVAQPSSSLPSASQHKERIVPFRKIIGVMLLVGGGFVYWLRYLG